MCIHNCRRCVFTTLVVYLGSLSWWKMKLLPIRCYCIRNQIWEYQFWQDPQHHWEQCISKPWMSLHTVIQMAADTVVPPYILSTTWTRKFQICIHQSVRSVTNNFQSTSCVIWQTSDLSPCFTSLRVASLQPLSYWQFLMRLHEQ